MQTRLWLPQLCNSRGQAVSCYWLLCVTQVLRIGSFAFPLAYVCVAVGAAVPEFMELLLAKLQQVR